MLNLNITPWKFLSNFEAEIITFAYPTEAEMKNGVGYKIKNVYLNINI